MFKTFNYHAEGYDQDFRNIIESLQNGYKKSLLSAKRIPIPNLKINTNHIEYKAFDGKDSENIKN